MAAYSVASQTYELQNTASIFDTVGGVTASPSVTVPSQVAVRRGIKVAMAALEEKLRTPFENRALPYDVVAALGMELEVQRLFAQAADLFFHQIVLAVHQNERFVDQVMAASLSARNLYDEGTRTVEVKFLGGSTLDVQTPYILKRDRRRRRPGQRKSCRGKQGNGCYPVLRQLGMLEHASAGLVSEIGFRIAHASYEDAHKDLRRRGVAMDLKTVKEIALRLGAKGLLLRERLLNEAEQGKRRSGALRGKRVVVSTDGGRLKCKKPGRGRRRKNGRRGYTTFWREPKLVAIYVVDESGKKIKDEVLQLDGTLGDADEVFRLLVGYLKLLGAHEAKELIVVADGALWIWNRIDTLVEEVGIDKRKVRQVVDNWHSVKRLNDISKKCRSWSEKKRRRWVRKVEKSLFKGDIDTVLDECSQLARGRRSKDIKELLDYFDRNRARMQYASFKRRKIPLGSGVIESAVRRVINLRLKGPGIIWLEKNAERVLHLRAQAKAGVWDSFVVAALTFDPAEEAHECFIIA